MVSNALATVILVGTVSVTGREVAVAVRETARLTGRSANTLTAGLHLSGTTNIAVAVRFASGGIRGVACHNKRSTGEGWQLF